PDRIVCLGQYLARKRQEPESVAPRRSQPGLPDYLAQPARAIAVDRKQNAPGQSGEGESHYGCGANCPQFVQSSPLHLVAREGLRAAVRAPTMGWPIPARSLRACSKELSRARFHNAEACGAGAPV